MKNLFLFASCLLICLFLSACAGVDSLFSRDPLTGGVNNGMSELLHCQLPAGMQFFPSHSFIEGDNTGLETYRGAMDPAAAGLAMHHTLKSDGWQLRLSLRAGNRYLYVYDKSSRLAVVVFRKQGVMTIMEIWSGVSLPDGAELAPRSLPDSAGMNAIEGEEYGSIEEIPAQKEESWGVEEREL